jgi:Na+-driven multidrug efflux pump
LVTTNAAMNARSKAVHSMGLSLMRIFAVYLPFAWIGVWAFGYPGILIATICANLFGVFGSLVAARAVGLFKTRLPLIARPAGLLPG